MSWHKLAVAVLSLALTAPVFADKKPSGSQVEPSAGQWRTWAISSGRDYRVPRPPRPDRTQAELRTLADLISHNDAASAAQIAYWDAGPPSYRWIDLISKRLFAGTPTSAFPHRVYAYVAMAMYDATVATWESKYYYQRPRPSEIDHNLPTAVEVPDSPSYPSEHSATAQAAASVLAYLSPRRSRDVPGDGGRSGVVARAGGRAVSQRSRRGRGTREARRRAGDREGERGWVEHPVDGHGARGALPLDRREPRQRRGRDLDAAAALVAGPIPSAGPAGVRLAGGAGRRRRGAHISADVRDQLQGVLLAEPRGAQPVAVPLHGRLDGRGPLG